MSSVRNPVRDARGKLRKHEGSVRDGRGAVELLLHA